MIDENERSVALAGSVAERPLGDPEIAVEILRLRVAELEEAIRRLAEQDATLTDAEREAVAAAARIIDAYEEEMDGFPSGAAAILRGLLDRLK